MRAAFAEAEAAAQQIVAETQASADEAAAQMQAAADEAAADIQELRDRAGSLESELEAANAAAIGERDRRQSEIDRRQTIETELRHRDETLAGTRAAITRLERDADLDRAEHAATLVRLEAMMVAAADARAETASTDTALAAQTAERDRAESELAAATAGLARAREQLTAAGERLTAMNDGPRRGPGARSSA